MSDHDAGVAYLEVLLRDRVVDVSPDLDARAAEAIRAGVRVRRRRRIVGMLMASAGVVAVIVGGNQLNVSLGSPAPASGVTIGPAARPSTASSSSAVCSKAMAIRRQAALAAAHSAGTGREARAAKQRLARRLARLESSAADPAACKKSLRAASLSSAVAKPEQLPVTLVAPGWTCGTPADEKFICTHGDASVVVNVRPADEHDAYLKDPDKAGPDQYVSDVHGKLFATIGRAPNGPAVSVTELGQDLVWK